MPLAATTQQIVQATGRHDGYTDVDFAALLELQANASGLALEPENVDVDDGLSPNGDIASVHPALSSARWRRSATPPQALFANVCATIARDRLNRVEKETGWPASRPPNSKRRPAST